MNWSLTTNQKVLLENPLLIECVVDFNGFLFHNETGKPKGYKYITSDFYFMSWIHSIYLFSTYICLVNKFRYCSLSILLYLILPSLPRNHDTYIWDLLLPLAHFSHGLSHLLLCLEWAWRQAKEEEAVIETWAISLSIYPPKSPCQTFGMWLSQFLNYQVNKVVLWS